MAAKLLIEPQSGIELPEGAPRPTSHPTGGSPLKAMNRESQVRSVAVLLFLLTVAAVVFAGFNLNSEWKFQVPDDGVWWVEQGGHLTADRDRPQRTRRQEWHQARRPTGFHQRAGSPEYFWTGAPALPQRHLVQGRLFPAPAIGPARFQRHSGSGRALPQQLAAADCADLSGHRPLRPAAPLDCSRIHALLYFLPRLFHCLLLQIHGQAERFRLDDLLGQHRRWSAAAGPVSALRSDLP